MVGLVQNTHTLGIFSLIAAALATAVQRERGWLILATFLLSMAAVIATDASWIMHDRARAVLISGGMYDRHYGVQVAITSAAGLLLTVVAVGVLHAQRGALQLASLATMALIMVFAAQAISIHSVDAILGRRAGPVMIVGWLWAIGASMVTVASIWPRHRA